MYEDNVKKISWFGIIKRLIYIIIIIAIVFLVIALITRCTKNTKTETKKTDTEISLKEELNKVEAATIKYLNKDNLPTELNSSKTVKLKYLINKDLTESIKDSEGNVCDASSSYSEVTKLENNYVIKTVVNCGKHSDYKISYIGCFDSCKDGELCLGEETSKDGICNAKEETKKEETETKTETSTKQTSTEKTSTDSKKTAKKTLYEYKKVTMAAYCKEGKLEGNNCIVQKTEAVLGKVKETTKTIDEIVSKSAAKTTTVFLKNTSLAQDTATEKYVRSGYDRTQGYKYTKYYCTQGTIQGESCIVSKTVTKTIRTCEDLSYTYMDFSGRCVKDVTTTVSTPAEYKEDSIEYIWSEKTSLDGWIKTGRTKTE